MKTAFFALSLFSSSLALPILRPTAAPVAPAKRQIGVSILSSHTLSGAAHEEHDSLAKAAAAATGVILGVGSDASASSDAESATATETSASSSAEETSSSSEKKAKASKTSSAESKAKETAKAAAASSGNGGNPSLEQDLVVLNFANTLERLESGFYKEGLDKFSVNDMVKAGLTKDQASIIVEALTVAQKDEAAHQATLEATIKALGGEVNNACSFDFSAGLTDPATFIATARALELVGVSAYSGGAQLIQNPSILEAAASILPIEARHSTIINLFAGGNAIPSAFDIPLTPNSILALAGGFLKGCAPEDLGLTSNVPVTVIEQEHGTALIRQNSLLAFQSDALSSSTDADNTFCQMLPGGAAEALVFKIGECKVPSDISGPVMVFVTNSKTPLVGDAATQDQSIIVAGPAAVFVDATPQSFEKLFSVHGVTLQTLASTGGATNLEKSGKSKSYKNGMVVKDYNSKNSKSNYKSYKDTSSKSSYDYLSHNSKSSSYYQKAKRSAEAFGVRVIGWK